MLTEEDYGVLLFAMWAYAAAALIVAALGGYIWRSAKRINQTRGTR